MCTAKQRAAGAGISIDNMVGGGIIPKKTEAEDFSSASSACTLPQVLCQLEVIAAGQPQRCSHRSTMPNPSSSDSAELPALDSPQLGLYNCTLSARGLG
jgi:hypothetical protein